jgi:hypothetical protein
MGRKLQLNNEVIEQICQFLPRVLYIETAAALAGVSHRSLQDWLKRGKEARQKARRTGEPVSRADEIYATLSEKFRHAVAVGELRALNCIIDAGEYDWRAAAWMLEKRFPSRWGRDRAEVLALQKRVRELEEQHGLAPAQRMVRDGGKPRNYRTRWNAQSTEEAEE